MTAVFTTLYSACRVAATWWKTQNGASEVSPPACNMQPWPMSQDRASPLEIIKDTFLGKYLTIQKNPPPTNEDNKSAVQYLWCNWCDSLHFRSHSNGRESRTFIPYWNEIVARIDHNNLRWATAMIRRFSTNSLLTLSILQPERLSRATCTMVMIGLCHYLWSC